MPWAATVFRRSSPEEDFLMTLLGVQSLLEQQTLLLSEYQAIYGTAKQAIPKNKITKRDSERSARRTLEMESLREFQERMDQTLDRKNNVLYEVCDL